MELNYHLTKFSAGYRGYRKYLYRFGLDEFPNCPESGVKFGNPQCTMVHCPRFMDCDKFTIGTIKKARSETSPENTLDAYPINSWLSHEEMGRRVGVALMGANPTPCCILVDQCHVNISTIFIRKAE